MENTTKRPTSTLNIDSYNLYKIEEENNSSQNSSALNILRDSINTSNQDELDENKTDKSNKKIKKIIEIQKEENVTKSVTSNSDSPFQKRKFGSVSNSVKTSIINIKHEDSDDSDSDDSDVSSEERPRKHKVSQIEFIENENQLQKAKNQVSFYEGRPRDENDILKLECPLYSVDRNTIITQRVSKGVRRLSELRNNNNSSLSSGRKMSTNLRKMNTLSEFKSKAKEKKPDLLDIKLGNTLQIRTFNSLFMTILQIINCIIRYTIIQFPFCIKTLGLIYGPIIISIIGSMSIFSIYMLIKVKESTGESSYSTFAFKWWGLKGKIFILILNCFSSFGSCLSYIIIFLKVMPNLVNIGIEDSVFSNQTVLSLILGLWLLFYCYQKDISGIKRAAFWGVLGIIVYLILNILTLLIYSWYEIIPEEKDVNFLSLNWLDYDTYSCIACIILSFSFHTYAFSIYECLDSPDQNKMIVTSSIGIFISMLIYLLVGTIGYILYGAHISDSILDSMGYGSLGVLANLSFVVNVVMSFPLTFSALKHYLMYLVEILVTLIRDSCCKKNNQKEKEMINKIRNTSDRVNTSSIKNVLHEEENETHQDETMGQKEYANEEDHGHANEDANANAHSNDHNNAHSGHMKLVFIPDYVEYILIFFVFGLIFYTAILYPDMKTIFGFLGATTANLFSFILPAMYFIKFSNHGVCNFKNILPFSFIIIGFVGLIVCVTSNIFSLIHGGGH